MQWHPLTLNLTKEESGVLKEINRTIIGHLEGEGIFSPTPATLQKLETALTKIVAKHDAISGIISSLAVSHDHCVMHLQHSDNEILNLPWTLAKCDGAGRALGSVPRLYLAKSLTPSHAATALPRYEPRTAAPLKILVMISSPVDSAWKSVLSYDEEEMEILSAFQPLMQRGDVEIDFTEDGSLDALNEKIRENRYHIVHFSGHGVFTKNEGYLELEDPVTLRAAPTPGRAFAEALVANPDHCVPLVMLSSCQTAKGTTEQGLSGVTNSLLQVGVPAIVSMGMSIQDKYAAAFSAGFYREIAMQRTIAEAFRSAVDMLRELEARENAKGFAQVNRPPLQWMIPNLYLSATVEHVVKWDTKREPIRHRAFRFFETQNRIILKHDKNYQFIGRREDKAKILPALFAKKTILLKGQGGVGKTALAEKLVQRLIANNPKAFPFVFDETTKTIQAIEEALRIYLTREVQTYDFITTLQHIDKAIEKITYLITEVSKHCNPVFVFDNLEDFMAEKGGPFAPEYEPLKEVLTFLSATGRYHLILTCRYLVPDVGGAEAFDLNQVRFNDFWKKCTCLELKELQAALVERRMRKMEQQGVPERETVEFVDIVKMLYGRFGGNFRALEFFNRLYAEDPERIVASLGSIDEFDTATATDIADVRDYMGKNLFFNELVGLLNAQERRILSLLAGFRIPVQAFALLLQTKSHDATGVTALLGRLHDLTLIEMSLDRETKLVYYYATPLLKSLLAGAGFAEDNEAFSHETAGVYHYHVCENIGVSLAEDEEAFYHFHLVKNGERVNEIGGRISSFYYGESLFRNAFTYCRMVYELTGDETSANVLNIMGLLFDLFGDRANALIVYLQAQRNSEEVGDKSNEGAAFNNISAIYYAQGDYTTSLEYLKKSLAISQEVGDKSGEGTTLNNISDIYRVQGDLATALEYLKRSLAIQINIGNERGKGRTLNNISQIYHYRGDYGTALEYLKKSLTISLAIGDKHNEGRTLNDISQIYSAQGDYGTALEYLKKSLTNCQEIGNKSGEGTTLSNISIIYIFWGDFAKALEYLNKSLTIRQEIGDKHGEGTALNNISQIYRAQGDNGTALEYLKKSLTISQEIGDKRGEGTILNNISTIYSAQGDNTKALEYLKKGLAIQQDIGDKHGEGATLNNISQIYSAQGDNIKALEYLKKSLAISQDIGDKRGEMRALHNMAMSIVYSDLQQYFTYESQAYSLAKETGDAEGFFKISKNLGNVLCIKGRNDQGLPILQQAYEIGLKAGYPDTADLQTLINKYQTEQP